MFYLHYVFHHPIKINKWMKNANFLIYKATSLFWFWVKGGWVNWVVTWWFPFKINKQNYFKITYITRWKNLFKALEEEVVATLENHFLTLLTISKISEGRAHISLVSLMYSIASTWPGPLLALCPSLWNAEKPLLFKC